MKILKWIIILLVALGLIGFITFLVLDEDLPKGEKGEKAERLADQMLAAVNDSAWQEIAIVSWDYTGQHQLIWDKDRHWAKVSWDNYDVYIRLDNKTGAAFAKGKKIERDELLNELLKEAYALWANDSFWLNPITKIRDDGTERRFVTQSDEKLSGLLVSYTKGGVTPGDSYLWLVNKNTGLPESVKMWVEVIPIGGIKYSWENWHTTPSGAKIAQDHEGLLSVKIQSLKTWSDIENYPAKGEFKVLEQ